MLKVLITCTHLQQIVRGTFMLHNTLLTVLKNITTLICQTILHGEVVELLEEVDLVELIIHTELKFMTVLSM